MPETARVSSEENATGANSPVTQEPLTDRPADEHAPASELDGASAVTPPAAASVHVVDIPIERVRRPIDLVLFFASVLGVALVMIVGVYAQGTTTGVTEDVQSAFSTNVRNFLLVPIGLIEGALVLVIPIVVAVERLWQRNVRVVFEAAAAAVLAALLTMLGVWVLERLATENLLRTVQVWVQGELTIVISPSIAALAALLTAIGNRQRSRLVALAWSALWVVLVVTVIVGTGTIVGTVTAVLLGRSTGLGVRCLMGVRSQRAHGASLVDAVRRAGVDAVSVVRITGQNGVEALVDERFETTTPVGYDVLDRSLTGRHIRSATDSAPITIQRPTSALPVGIEVARSHEPRVHETTVSLDEITSHSRASGAAESPTTDISSDATATAGHPTDHHLDDHGSDLDWSIDGSDVDGSDVDGSGAVGTFADGDTPAQATTALEDSRASDAPAGPDDTPPVVVDQQTNALSLDGPGGTADASRPGSASVASPLESAGELAEPATITSTREGSNRVYAVGDSEGRRWDAVVLDRDRQVMGLLSWVWTTLRMGGIGRRNAVSMQQAADRAALMAYATEAAGLEVPRLHGIARTDESIVLLGEHLETARTLDSLEPDLITDEMMAQAWEQLLTAHQVGISHRNLSGETILVEPSTARVWLSSWEQGDIASSVIVRHMDMTQLLVAFALQVGPERAVAAARSALGVEQVQVLAPMIQSVALPAHSRSRLRTHRRILQRIREHLVSVVPEDAPAQEIRLTRFSARTVVTATIAVAALWIVLTTFNFADIATVVAEANVAWMIISFAAGSMAFVGAAMGLIALSPEPLRKRQVFLVQIASSVVNLVTPAAMGPAALNLRLLQKSGVKTALAAATVGLLQVSQFITSIVLILVIALTTGSRGALSQLPSGALITIVVALTVIAAILFLVPNLRRWIIGKIGPTLKQVTPRLIWVLGQPRRILLVLAGNTLQNLAYLVAFGAALYAFGQTMPAATLVIVYLTGTAIGSMVPTPGGIGTVELALSTGLRTAGIGTAHAASTAVLFRVLTFWIRIPMGWFALRYLQKRNII